MVQSLNFGECPVINSVNITLSVQAVPTLPAAWELANTGAVPGGIQNNLAYVSSHVTFAPEISHVAQLIVTDAQTSGGLLISLPEDRAEALLTGLQECGVIGAACIGRVMAKGNGHIMVDA